METDPSYFLSVHTFILYVIVPAYKIDLLRLIIGYIELLNILFLTYTYH